MNVARHNASCVIVEDKFIIVAGGSNDQNVAINSVELYDPKNDKWLKLASMNMRRDSFALINSNRFSYAIGFDAFIERISPEKNCWETVSTQSNANAFEESQN